MKLAHLCMGLALCAEGSAVADEWPQVSPAPAPALAHFGIREGVALMNTCHYDDSDSADATRGASLTSQAFLRVGYSNFEWLSILSWSQMPFVGGASHAHLALGYIATGARFHTTPHDSTSFVWEEAVGVGFANGFWDMHGPCGNCSYPASYSEGASTSTVVLLQSSIGVSFDHDWELMLQTWIGTASGAGVSVGRSFEL
jgi:hypothetical protein